MAKVIVCSQKNELIWTISAAKHQLPRAYLFQIKTFSLKKDNSQGCLTRGTEITIQLISSKDFYLVVLIFVVVDSPASLKEKL